MAVLPLFYYPHPILKKVSEEVREINSDIQQLIDDMFDTMNLDNRGGGLAAVQVGRLLRIMILDVGKKEDDYRTSDPHVFINPKITYLSEEQIIIPEGCLSFPGAWEKVPRSDRVRVEYLDRNGQKCELEADDYLARGVQHEFDHLNGITMDSKLSMLKKDMFLRKVTKHVNAAKAHEQKK